MKKLKVTRRFIDVVLMSIVAILFLKASLSGDYQKYTLILSGATILFGLWVFFHLHLNQLLESEEAINRSALGYLYAEELRDYAVANIEALFNAVNQIEKLPSKESLPLPPLNHIQLGDVDKPLGTRERDTLLTIIAALAKEAKLQIDQPGKTALYIEGLTNELGAPVSKRAIEDHLKKIPNALETRMK